MNNCTLNQNIFFYLDFPFALITSIVVGLTALVFTRIKEPRMMVYLKLESVFNLIECFVFALTPFLTCTPFLPRLDRMASMIASFSILFFLAAVAELSSLIMTIFTSFACLLLFKVNKSSHRLSCFLKLNPYLCATLGFAFSAGLFSYLLFALVGSINAIGRLSATSNQTYIFINYLGTRPYSILITLSFVTSYGLMYILLTLINCLILGNLHALQKRKTQLKNTKTNQKEADESSKKIAKLVIIDFMNLIIGRLPTICYALANELFKIEFGDFPILSIGSFWLMLSFNIRFFLFYRFNRKFNKQSKKIFSYFKKKIHFCYSFKLDN